MDKKKTIKTPETPIVPDLDEKEKNRVARALLKKLQIEYAKAIQLKAKAATKKGRPTKYLREEVTEIFNVVSEVLSYSNFFDYCSVDNVCVYLDISKMTFYRWIKKHKEFKTAARRWEQKRNSIFYIYMLKLKPGVWIFLAKNWLGMSDKQITELEMKGSIISQYISHIPTEQPGYRVKKTPDLKDSELTEDLTDPIIDDIESKDTKEKKDA